MMEREFLVQLEFGGKIFCCPKIGSLWIVVLELNLA